MRFIRLVLALALLIIVAPCAHAAAPLRIVAAENFYADLARQIAGPDAAVEAILSNPNQDPHDFEASPATARLIAGADVVIYNGADYDPWMASLLKAAKAPDRHEVVVAALLGRQSGDNPHLWYDPAAMPAAARALAAELVRRDPAHAGAYDSRLQGYLASLKPLDDKIAELKAKYAGTAVSATEPVFGYMAEALGLVMRNQRFQLAVMNGTEPSIGDVAAFESDIKARRVRVLFYNSQVSDDLTGRLQSEARAAKIPVVAISETEPPDTTYPAWMVDQLVALDHALTGAGS